MSLIGNRSVALERSTEYQIPGSHSLTMSRKEPWLKVTSEGITFRRANRYWWRGLRAVWLK